MATFSYDYVQETGSSVDIVVGTATVTYTTSQTNTGVTATVSKISIKNNSQSGTHTYGYSITFDGSVVASGSISGIGQGSTSSKTISGSKTVSRDHSAKTARLAGGGSVSGVSGVYASGNASVSVPARPSYSVSYYANGGSGAPSAQTKWYGESLTLSSTKPTRTNHSFYHWNTTSSNTGTTYSPGGTYTANAALGLYAIWNPIVSFNANGGTGAPSSQTKTYGTTLYLSSTRPTRSGYVFKEWNTSSSGTGTAYSPGGQYTSNSPATLYAIWNAVVTYDANGGTGSPSSQTKTYGATLTLTTTRPTRSGYAFKEWNTRRDGTGTAYASGGSFTSEVATTLYAQWTKSPDPPTISSLTVVRCDSTGAAKDDGTFCRVVAKWSIDTANVSGNMATVTGTIGSGAGTARAITFASGASGTGGTAEAIVSGCDTDTQYTVTVTATDRLTSTSRSDVLTRARFIFDLGAGGTSMGIGSAAPNDGLEIGWPTQFDDDVTMLEGLATGGNLTVGGHLTAPELTVTSDTSDIVSSSTGWTVQSQAARTYGKSVMVSAELRPNAAVAAGSTNTIGTLQAGFRPALMQGFSNALGNGTVSGYGSISFHNDVALTTSSTVYVGLTFIKE